MGPNKGGLADGWSMHERSEVRVQVGGRGYGVRDRGDMFILFCVSHFPPV